MRVIIPAAGNGTRFLQAGYRECKPCIVVAGRPMLHHVLDVVSAVDTKPIVLCQEKDVDDIGLTTDFHTTTSAHLLPIRYGQQGAALTMLCLNGEVQDNEPILVVDSDNIYDPHWFRAFTRDFIPAMHGASCLLTTIVEPGTTRYSYVTKSQVGNKVVCIHEKDPVSNRVTCGVNFFSSWAALRRGICTMVAQNETVNGEFYLAPTYNHFREPVYFFDIPREAFRTVGTPEELLAYEKEITVWKIPANQRSV